MDPSTIDSCCLASIVSGIVGQRSRSSSPCRMTRTSHHDHALTKSHRDSSSSSGKAMAAWRPLKLCFRIKEALIFHLHLASNQSGDVLLELVPGAVGGFCNVLVGHPLDLLKVRMQASATAAATVPSSSLSAAWPATLGKSSNSVARLAPLANRLQPTNAICLSQSTYSLMVPAPNRPRHFGKCLHPGQWKKNLYSRIPVTTSAKTNTLLSPLLRYPLTTTTALRTSNFFTAPVTLSSVTILAAASNSPEVTASATSMTLREMLQDVVRRGGVRGLYAGVTAPLLATVPAFGVTVSTFEMVKNLQQKQHERQRQFAPSFSPQLSVASTALAGAASGIPAAFILGPLERIKCQFQLLHSGRYPSVMESAFRAQQQQWKAVVVSGGAAAAAAEGSPYGRHHPARLTRTFREVFRGTGLTVLRDVPGNAMYFAVYEWTRRELLASLNFYSSSSSSSRVCRRARQQERGSFLQRVGPQVQLAITMLAGGIAGVANWCLCLPVDAVKTRWQTSPPGLYKNPWHVAHTIMTEGSGDSNNRRPRLSRLFIGLRPALLRAFPANAAALCGVEVTRQALQDGRS